jgi:hypothetical protein
VGSGALGANNDGESVAIGYRHNLCAFAAFCFPDLSAPSFAGAKLASINASRTSIAPWAQSCRASVVMIFVIIPERTQFWNRRWQVWNEGYRSGRSAQGAPVLSTHRIQSRTDLLLFQGRPLPSGRVLGLGMSGWRIFQCSSVRSRAWRILS